MRFLFYSHDGFGLGHTRRHLAVASALAGAAKDATILLVTGTDEVARLGLPARVEIMKLPALRKVANEEYSSRHLAVSFEEIRALRSDLLLTLVKSFRPNVTLVDKHPFGASGEFKAGLKALRKLGGRSVLGFRDILDEPERVRAEWRPYGMQRRIANYYDRVLIYGERAIFDPVSVYAFPDALAERTLFCGYVVRHDDLEELVNFSWPFPLRPERKRPVVLATAGGGEDGFQLLKAFVEAAQTAPWQGVAVAGPMTPEPQFAALQRYVTAGGVSLRRFVPHLSALLGSVDALVCMGGYNTLAEAVSLGVPTVCVPRVAPRTEQLIRALAFERLGLLKTVTPDKLAADSLRAAVNCVLTADVAALRARAHAALSFEGARRTAELLTSLAAEKSSRTNIQSVS